jgi:hypothetical protein
MAARKKPAGQTKEERDRISRGRIESFIDGLAAKHLQCPSCKKKMEASDLKDIPSSVAMLIKARYDKLAPSLQAVEQTVIDSRDKADPADLEAKLVSMFAENPALLEGLVSVATASAPELRARLREQLAEKIVH